MFALKNFVTPLNAILLLSSVAKVTAHGWVAAVTIDGTRYPGWDPTRDGWQNPIPQRIVRSRIPNDSPVENEYSPDMACNVNGNAPQPYTGALLLDAC